jgi:RNA-binding protein YhbY
VLSNNGLTDKYIKEIEDIFHNKRLISVDLSGNLFWKTGSSIGSMMRTDVKHLQYLDLS